MQTVQHRRPRWQRGVIAGLSLVLILAACSGGGDTSSEPDIDEAADETTENTDATDTGDVTSQEATGDGPTDLVVDVLNEPDSLDPLYRDSPETQIFYRNVYSALLRWEEDATLAPDLAADLPEVSDDRLTYTVSLRDDVVFHDGSEFTSADVVYSYNRIIDDETAVAWRFETVAEVEAAGR